ncbi:Hypothetical predicted protein [Paramuricea clavata]|uniref:Uncharacterized protein n=1 Tax=Paramuricea clavata TaxID=317549 RepID=A0A7D9HSK0_PARCT|nr:Hypothetical predicted protein [Paramuricea clavata]
MQNCLCEPKSCYNYRTNLLNQWKSLPNLLVSQNCDTLNLQQKRSLFQTRQDTLVPCYERSKSMDFAYSNCDVHLTLVDEENAMDFSTYDLYLSKDFTDLMDASLSERSDIDSNEVRTELDDSFDCWSELQSSELTQTNLSQSLASQMYSYENLDRVGKNLYKINKWFQRCSIDNEDSNERTD